MSKSKKSPNKVKKSIKPAKTKSAPKKAKAAKPAKKTASKAKPVKKATKKVVKKSAPKKAVKSAKKASKPAKPVKKASAAAKPLKKAAAKPAKKAGKVDVIIAKSKKGVKTAPAKAVKAAKPVKPLKAAKPEKPVKESPVKEGKKTGAPVTAAPKTKSKAGRKPKSKGDDDEPEIIHDELIEQLIQSTKKKKQGPKVPKIIKTFVNPMASLAVASDEIDKKGPKKEPKGKFELEYVIRTSAGILYELISTPSGLSEWFSDDVNIRDGYFTFFWDGSEQRAKLLGFKEEKYIRLRWVDKPEGTFFEFRIERDELTGDISLIITDFADEASDQQTSKLLWDSQVNKLLGVLGSN